MNRYTFVCEQCYHEAQGDPAKMAAAVKKNRKNRYTVNIVIWSTDNSELRHRIQVRQLCKVHADEFAAKVKGGDLPVVMQEAML